MPATRLHKHVHDASWLNRLPQRATRCWPRATHGIAQAGDADRRRATISMMVARSRRQCQIEDPSPTRARRRAVENRPANPPLLATDQKNLFNVEPLGLLRRRSTELREETC